jgi:hypothetical protein
VFANSIAIQRSLRLLDRLERFRRVMQLESGSVLGRSYSDGNGRLSRHSECPDSSLDERQCASLLSGAQHSRTKHKSFAGRSSSSTWVLSPPDSKPALQFPGAVTGQTRRWRVKRWANTLGFLLDY